MNPYLKPGAKTLSRGGEPRARSRNHKGGGAEHAEPSGPINQSR